MFKQNESTMDRIVRVVVGLVDPHLGIEIVERQAALRSMVRAAADLRMPTPSLSVSPAYFDGDRSAWLPANMA